MAPLVGYDSSDDDEEEVQQPETTTQAQEVDSAQNSQLQTSEELTAQQTKPAAPEPRSEIYAPAASASASAPQPGPSLPPDSASIGPSLPPEDGGQSYPEEMDQYVSDEDPSQPPASPYTANRSLIHNLTLPTVPDLDIPPSPPGSPSLIPAHTALTAKIDKFLELKRKKGTHFNARIADSHALRNPPLMDKLLGFVGVGTTFSEDSVAGTEQYATTLPTELWDPSSFPDWAYRVQLRKTQERLQKEKGRERGEAVQFVPASS